MRKSWLYKIFLSKGHLLLTWNEVKAINMGMSSLMILDLEHKLGAVDPHLL